MHAEFNSQFEIGKQFDSRKDMEEAVSAFGKKFNVVFSIRNSHPSKGQFHYICKHGGVKRETTKKDEDESIETIDLTNNKESTVEDKTTPVEKKTYKKSTQKFECPAAINIFKLKVTTAHVEHNHPISQDVTTYAIHRKQSPKTMELIYSILASGHRDPITSVLDVGIK